MTPKIGSVTINGCTSWTVTVGHTTHHFDSETEARDFAMGTPPEPMALFPVMTAFECFPVQRPSTVRTIAITDESDRG